MDEATDTTEVIGPHHLTVVGEFLLDRETIRVWRGNKPLQLSMKQFRLLEIFMRHPGKAFSRKELKELVWGPESTIADGNVDGEIVRLRRAIGGRRRETPIRTIRKLGYAFEASKRRASSKRKPGTSDADIEKRP